MRGGGGGCWACFRSGPISVGGGGGSKRSAPLFPGPQEEPAHGLHPRFVVAEIWADRAGGGGIAVPQAYKKIAVNCGEIAVKLHYTSFRSPDSMPAMSSFGAQDFLQKGLFDQLCTQLVG